MDDTGDSDVRHFVFGWAVILEPEQISMLRKDESDLTKILEVLPISETVWTIGEKPAGWRRLNIR